MINNTLTYISLFSSAGVGCYVFKHEGFECVATNEIIDIRLEVQRINKKCKFDSDYINGETEFGRIFTKVINPLVFKFKKQGTERVRISKNTITLSYLQYNRANWRDELSVKDKSIIRAEHEPTVAQLQARAVASYMVNKAKKEMFKFNDSIYNGKSAVYQATEMVNAIQAHHIFTQSDYPTIADYVENLIMLTPN